MTISVASLVASGKLASSDARLPMVAGLSANTVSKMVVAAIASGYFEFVFDNWEW